MKKMLIVSFDLIRKGEVNTSLSIASNLAFLKGQQNYGTDFVVMNISFNMFEVPSSFSEIYFLSKFQENKIEFEKLDTIAISAYIWSEYLVNKLIATIKKNGFSGKIALGGYQVSYSTREELTIDYPQSDIFIFGYAEKALLLSLYLQKEAKQHYLNEILNIEEIPSVYLTKEIDVVENQKMVRIETKRGCPYKCSFCAHRDLRGEKIKKHSLDKIFSELAFLKDKNVQRINVLDPVFNTGSNYLSILDELIRINYSGEITFQTRFENINGKLGNIFLNKIEKLNATLEFGLQTIIESEYKVINRNNNIHKIKEVMKQLSDRNISYEISLIYGLPNQTIDSFKKSIDFVLESSCEKVYAYPLMLLKGTELFSQKKRFNLVEKSIGDFNIPVVVQSDSFTEVDYYKMQELSESLNNSKKERFL